jgi:hypothetical protein
MEKIIAIFYWHLKHKIGKPRAYKKSQEIFLSSEKNNKRS